MRNVYISSSIFLRNFRVLPVLLHLSAASTVCYNKDCARLKSREEDNYRQFSTGMEWRSRGAHNEDLINQLKKYNIIKSTEVEQAMKAVDRGNYCSRSPYVDSPQGIGFDVTISAPHMHAHALEILKDHLKEGNKVLDVGSGSGYLCACMAQMVGKTGLVVGIDRIQGLVDLSKKNILKQDKYLLDEGRVKLYFGDGWDGCKDDAPFDAIHVGAAAATVPDALVNHLKPGGRLFIPVGAQYGEQYLEQIDKNQDGSVTRKRLMGVRYVPLVNENKKT